MKKWDWNKGKTQQVGNTCYYASLKWLKKQKHEWRQEIFTEKIERVSHSGKEWREKG